MITMYGYKGFKNEYYDLAPTLRGAKISATRRGIDKIYRRVGYNTHLAAYKSGKKWFKA